MKLYRPSLQAVLFVAFMVTSIVPVVLLGWWVTDTAKSNEYKAVEEKHLLVAKNLTLALSRYAQDTASILNNFQYDIQQPLAQSYLNLLSAQNMTSIRAFYRNGNAIFAIDTSNGEDASPLTKSQFQSVYNQQKSEQVQFLPIQLNATGKPSILITKFIQDGQIILVSELNGDYFSLIQSKVKFGQLGHAAIVDQKGNVIAHPKASWVSQMKNISKVSAVKRMMNRETGVQLFYSPAKKADMIAGFSFVNETGWGVMVPQPISELEEKISYFERAVLNISVLGILLAMLISWFLAKKLSRPTIQLANLTQRLKINEELDESFLIQALTLEQNQLNHSFHEMVHAIREKNKNLLYNSQHDPLTGLANRNFLRSHLSKIIEERESFIFALLDLNNFKEINDHWSHSHGDETLKHVADRLLTTVGDKGLVTRIGGDEFAIILNNKTTPEQAETLMTLIRNQLKMSYQVFTETLKIDSSCGLAVFPDDAENVSDLMQCADLAMYDAKRGLKSHVSWFKQHMRDKLSKKVELTQAFKDAIAFKQFVIHYQAKVDPFSYKLLGFEALVRWLHPERGLVYPAEFIELAESTSMIIPMGEQVLQQVCKDITQFKQHNKNCVPIAINLSAVQFNDPQIIEMINNTLSENHLDGDCVEFEITESAITGPIDELVNKVADAGFDVSIDDFGTGQSSLARIRDFKIKNIKIDRSFVMNIENSEKDYELLKSMVSIAHTLNLKTIVEGVETKAQLEMIKKLKCNAIQGFLFSRGVDFNTALQQSQQEQLLPMG